MGYPNERLLKPVYLTTFLFIVVLIVGIIVLGTAFTQWSLLPKAILLGIIITDVAGLVLVFVWRWQKHNKKVKDPLKPTSFWWGWPDLNRRL